VRAPGRLIAPAAGLLLVLLSLSGCGSSDNGVASKSPRQILAAAKAAAEGADSVHVVSEASQGRLKSSFDLRLSRDGGRGKVSLLGLDFELIRIGQTVYAKGDRAFYARLGAVLGKLPRIPEGSWLKGSASSGPLAQLASFTDMTGELARLLSTPGPVAKGARATVKGQQAITLKEKTKVYEGALYVAATGTPYPVEQVKSGGRERGKTSFSGWGPPVPLSAPSPALDVSSLKG
jgi:hypothetical protein